MLKLLLSRGANPNLGDTAGTTLLAELVKAFTQMYTLDVLWN